MLIVKRTAETAPIKYMAKLWSKVQFDSSHWTLKSYIIIGREFRISYLN